MCIFALLHYFTNYANTYLNAQVSRTVSSYLCVQQVITNACSISYTSRVTHQTDTPLKLQNITQRLAPLQSFDLNTTFMRAFPCFHLNKDETSSKFHVVFTEDSYILRKISS